MANYCFHLDQVGLGWTLVHQIPWQIFLSRYCYTIKTVVPRKVGFRTKMVYLLVRPTKMAMLMISLTFLHYVIGHFFCADGDTTSAASIARDMMRAQLLRTLGQYAVRVPDLAKEVQSTRFMEEHLIDAVLWTSF